MKPLLAMKSVLLRGFSSLRHLPCSDVRDSMRTGVCEQRQSSSGFYTIVFRCVMRRACNI